MFPGQRPPFPPGNTLARQHGATSPRAIAPLAEEFEANARSSTSFPEHLRDPSFGAEITAWCWAEAQVMIIRQYVAGLDLLDALADTSEERSEETSVKGNTTRLTTARRTRAALDLLDRSENRAARFRSRLGLTPDSRSRIARDLATASAMGGVEALKLRGAAILAARGDSLPAEHDVTVVDGRRSDEETGA